MIIYDLTVVNDNKYRSPACLACLENIINFWENYQWIEGNLIQEEKIAVRNSVATIANILHNAVGEQIDFDLAGWLGRGEFNTVKREEVVFSDWFNVVGND